jgi:hypothetical protein
MGPLSALADRFAFNDRFLDQLTDGFSEADWHAPAGEANHAQWLMGHLASTRRWALRLLGADAPAEAWEQHFGLGAHPSAQSDDISPALLRESFRRAGAELRSRLVAITPEQAAADFREFPWGTKDLSGGVHFLHFHECYHLGQLGLLRRMAGRPGLI